MLTPFTAVITNSANKRFVAEAAQLKGGFLMNRSKFAEAKAAFDLAITTDPTLGQAYVVRAQAGFVLFKESSTSAEDDFAALIRDIENATEVNPELTIAYYTGGTLLEYNGHK